jgi:hypothetical protein
MQPYCNGMENEMKNKLSSFIIDEHYRPTSTLLNILKTTGIEHNGTLENIVTETQKHWLRPANKERWENETVFILHHKNPSKLFTDLELIQEIKPAQQQYNHVVLLGSTIQSIRNRLAYLITLWNNGVRFDSINILAGQRPLDKTIESLEILLDTTSTALSCKQSWQLNGALPTTETEMIKMIFDQADLPSEWNNIAINFVETPMQQTENDSQRRPNTHDTIVEWITLYNPQAGSILAISSQPFIGYQDAVLRNFLPKNFTVETVGYECSNDYKIPTILDSLARWIYNEYQISKKHQ